MPTPFLTYPRGKAQALPLDLSSLTAAEASTLYQIASAARRNLVIRWNNERDDQNPRADKTAALILQAEKLGEAALKQERIAGKREAAARRAAA